MIATVNGALSAPNPETGELVPLLDMTIPLEQRLPALGYALRTIEAEKEYLKERENALKVRKASLQQNKDILRKNIFESMKERNILKIRGNEISATVASRTHKKLPEIIPEYALRFTVSIPNLTKEEYDELLANAPAEIASKLKVAVSAPEVHEEDLVIETEEYLLVREKSETIQSQPQIIYALGDTHEQQND